MHETLERLETKLATVLDGLDERDAQMTLIEHPEKWNIQQIVEHLLLSYRSTVGVLQTRIDKGRATLAKPTLQQWLGQFSLITLGYFPKGWMAPAEVSPTLPSELRSGDDLKRQIHEDLEALDLVASTAQGMFGRRRCASHMAMGPLSAQQWRKFHLVHGEHHIKQIRGIRQDHFV